VRRHDEGCCLFQGALPQPGIVAIRAQGGFVPAQYRRARRYAVSDIVLVKHADVELNEQQRQILAGVLFDMLGGANEFEQKKWRGFWRELMAAGQGEVFAISVKIIRDGVFHRRHMKLENVIFENQDAYYSFKQFRNWLKTGAGFVEWHVVRGQLVPEPKSISYEECDQLEMEKFHNDALAFLRTPRAQEQLWPALSAEAAADMVETLLSEFDA
jgi:hypothetical protein